MSDTYVRDCIYCEEEKDCIPMKEGMVCQDCLLSEEANE
jgi:hypothetical protein